jgi:hypothetical protein
VQEWRLGSEVQFDPSDLHSETAALPVPVASKIDALFVGRLGKPLKPLLLKPEPDDWQVILEGRRIEKHLDRGLALTFVAVLWIEMRVLRKMG